MNQLFVFDPDMLASMAGGRSALDIQFLNLHTVVQAEAFIYSYGFDIQKTEVVERLWYFHRRAIVLLTEKLGFSLEQIPEKLRDQKSLEDIRLLLVYASSRRAADKELQRWSCAILRSMHVFVHAESDLFSFFAEEIQKQILSPFDRVVSFSGSEHGPVLVAKESDLPSIELVEYTHKPFKTSTSTVVKLLAKPDALALKIFDKLGVRFITKSIFDSYQVLRFLGRENIISFPHIMPDQSSNNLYPSELFVKVCVELAQSDESIVRDSAELERIFEERLQQEGAQYKTLRKENSFSGEHYRFVKFISRKLVNIPPQDGKEGFSFFYPFEVQIMDSSAHAEIQSGPSEHEAYKERQRQAARLRLFPHKDV